MRRDRAEVASRRAREGVPRRSTAASQRSPGGGGGPPASSAGRGVPCGRGARSVIGLGVAPEVSEGRPARSSGEALGRGRSRRSASRRRSVGRGQWRRTARLAREMSQDRVDGASVLDAGEDPKPPAADRAGLDVDAEHAPQASGPAARGERGGGARRLVALGGRCLQRAGSASCRGDASAKMAVRCEHAVKAREVHARPGHEGCQAGKEVERLEHDLGGAVASRGP